MVSRLHISRGTLVRWLIGAVVVAMGICVGWTPWCLRRFQAALAVQDVGRAETWLNRADWLPRSAGERAFLRARLSRQLGRPEAFAASIERALQQGYPVERLEREDLLRRAQAGDLAPLEAQVGSLLIQGEDLPAICEAYVAGFRWIMLLSAGLALLSALGAWLMIDGKKNAGD